MASLQIIVKATDVAETVLSDRTIEYTHPAEIAGLYNQLKTAEQPNGSFIIFNEIPEDYVDSKITLLAVSVLSNVHYKVTLVGEIVANLTMSDIYGTVKDLDKAEHSITFDLISGDDTSLTIHRPYTQRPEFIHTDPTGVCRLAVICGQKIYTPQQENIRFDLTEDQAFYIEFNNGVTKIKSQGYKDILLVPITKIAGTSLEDFITDNSLFDRAVEHPDKHTVAITVAETMDRMGGRIFPLNEKEVLKALNIINTDARYESVRDVYLNPYTYGTVTQSYSMPELGMNKIQVEANNLSALLANVGRKFLVGYLIQKDRTDAALADSVDNEFALMGKVGGWTGQNMPNGTIPSNGGFYPGMSRGTLVTWLASAIEIDDYYLLPINLPIIGDSGRYVAGSMYPDKFSMPAPNHTPATISDLALQSDIRYTVDFPTRDLQMRHWPATPEEYAAVKTAFEGKSVDTTWWLDIFNTENLTESTIDGVRTFDWIYPQNLYGLTRLACGVVVNKTALDKALVGNYYDKFPVGTLKTSSTGNASSFLWEKLRQLQQTAVVIGDEYFFGEGSMLSPSDAFYSGLDLKKYTINFGDTDGSHWIENVLAAQLKFREAE